MDVNIFVFGDIGSSVVSSLAEVHIDCDAIADIVHFDVGIGDVFYKA